MSHIAEINLLVYLDRDGQTVFRYRDEFSVTAQGLLTREGAQVVMRLMSDAVDRVDGTVRDEPGVRVQRSEGER
jgi:hypothetical protein